ncbi:MAG: rhodanese-like domain-containing protein [Phycisphaerae bacterium]|nr:rhodanese-like domain-containing protein [Phycisphaerae bacterium]
MNTRRLIDILAAGVITVAALSGCNTTSEVEVDKARVSPEKVRDWLEKSPSKFLVVDARPQAAFAEGHLPGAVRMDPGELDPQDPDPKFGAYKSVIVYGESPAYGRANALTKRFLEAGVSVLMLDGGFKAWRDRGYSIEQP